VSSMKQTSSVGSPPVGCIPNASTLNVEAVQSSEMLTKLYRSAWRDTLGSSHYGSLKVQHFSFIDVISWWLAVAFIGLHSILLLFMICPSFDVLYARAIMGNMCGQVSEITLLFALWQFHDFVCLFILLLWRV
jgi:hypothetical protein